jgi:two-component system sensor histidine kinase DesK
MRFRLLPHSSPLAWTPYAYLVYLSFYLVYAAFNDSAREWVLDGAAIAAFLVLYFRGFWLHGTPLLRVAFGIVAIGVLTAPHNMGASCFFIYGAAFLCETGPPARAGRWLLVIIAIVIVESALLGLSPGFWVPAIVISLLVGGSNIHFAEVRRKDRALVQAHEEAERLAKVAERERIARDLHDLLGHTLSIIVLKSELAAKVAERDVGRAVREIRDVERISRNALAEVRQAIYGYRGERLLDEIASGRAALEAAGVTLETDVSDVPLGPDAERTLAMAVREAVTNVVRHARARRCRIALAPDGQIIRLTVEDDGVGGRLTEGAGLSGMRKRVSDLGGTLSCDGGHGTRLTITVPGSSNPPADARAAS